MPIRSPFGGSVPKGLNKFDTQAIDLTKELIDVGNSVEKQLFLKIVNKDKKSIEFAQAWDIDPMGSGKSLTAGKGLAEMITSQARYAGLKTQILEGNDIAAIVSHIEYGTEVLICIINDMHKKHSSVGGASKEMVERFNYLFEIRHIFKEKTGNSYGLILFLCNAQEESSIYPWLKKNIKIYLSSLTGDNENAIDFQQKHFREFGMNILIDNSQKIDRQGKQLYKSRKVVYLPTMYRFNMAIDQFLNPTLTYIGYVWIPPPAQKCDACGFVLDTKEIIEKLKAGEEVEDLTFFRQCPKCGKDESHFLIDEIIEQVPEITMEERRKEIMAKIEVIAPELITIIDFRRPEKKKRMTDALRQNYLDDYWLFAQDILAMKTLEERCIVLTDEMHKQVEHDAAAYYEENQKLVQTVIKEISEQVNLKARMKERIGLYLRDNHEELYQALVQGNLFDGFCAKCEDAFLKRGIALSKKSQKHRALLDKHVPVVTQICKDIMFREGYKPGGRKLNTIWIMAMRAHEDDLLLQEILNSKGYKGQIKMFLDYEYVINATVVATDQPQAVKFDTTALANAEDFKTYVRNNIDGYFTKIKARGKGITDEHVFAFVLSKKYCDITGEDLQWGDNTHIMDEINKRRRQNNQDQMLTNTSRIAQMHKKVLHALMLEIGLDFEVWYGQQKKKVFKEVIISVTETDRDNKGLADVVCVDKNNVVHFMSLKTSSKNQPSTLKIYDFAPEYLRALTFFLKVKRIIEPDERLIEHVLKVVHSNYFIKRKEKKTRMFEDAKMIKGWVEEAKDCTDVKLWIVNYNLVNHYLIEREIRIEVFPDKYDDEPYTGIGALFEFMPSAERDKLRL